MQNSRVHPKDHLTPQFPLCCTVLSSASSQEAHFWLPTAAVKTSGHAALQWSLKVAQGCFLTAPDRNRHRSLPSQCASAYNRKRLHSYSKLTHAFCLSLNLLCAFLALTNFSAFSCEVQASQRARCQQQTWIKDRKVCQSTR